MSISTELRQQVEDLALKAVVAEDPCGSDALRYPIHDLSPWKRADLSA